MSGRKHVLASVSEDTTHMAILDFLRLVLPRALIWHTPNGGRRDRLTACKLERLGVLPGVPDVLALMPDGLLLGFEIKRPVGGRVSDEQYSFGGAMLSAGHRWSVVRSIDDVRACLSVWGVATREAAE